MIEISALMPEILAARLEATIETSTRMLDENFMTIEYRGRKTEIVETGPPEEYFILGL